MDLYRDTNGDSGVDAYQIGDSFIRVRFKDAAVYLYTNESAGVDNIQQMKKLAQSGDGLNAFINKHVKKRYARKEG